MDMRKLKLFSARFRVITKAEAIKLGLFHHHNLYGDKVGRDGTRSLWFDEKGRWYKVKERKPSFVRYTK